MNNTSTSSKWTREEELKFIKEISQGIQLAQLSMTHNRSLSSLELRLKKIIFENILAGKSIEKISIALKMPQDKVRQYFYSYKELREKHKGIEDLDNINPNLIKNDEHTDLLKQDTISNNIQEGGGDSLITKMNNKIKQLETENQMIKTIIENKELHHKLNKMIKDGIIDHNVKLLIKEFRKKNTGGEKQ